MTIERVARPRQHVHRGRLVGRLGGRFEYRVVVIEAGAGFGKSLLLEQAMDARPSHHLDVFHRVSVDEVPTSILSSIGTQLASTQTAPTVEAVLQAMWHRAPSRVAVLLDDCHHLEAGGEAASMLDEFIERLPQNASVVLSGRSWPPLRLQRLLAHGDVLVLSEDDLAFDDDELEAFAALRNMGDGQTLHTRWPALMELEAATGMTGAQRYLVEEALSGFDHDRIAALRLLSAVDRFDDELVREATSFTGTARELVADLPLVTESADEVRLHDLWRELLGPQLTAGERRRVVRTAADLLRSRHDLVGAVGLLATSDDEEGQREIIRDLVCDHHNVHPMKTRRTVMAQLSSLDGSLEMDCLRAADHFTADPSRARPSLEAASARAREAGDTEMELFTIFRQGDVLYRSAGVDELRGLLARLQQLASENVPGAAAVGGLFQAWLLMLDNDYVEAERRLDDPVLANFAPVAEMLPYLRAVVSAYSGYITRALNEIETIAASPSGRTENRMGGFVMVQRWFIGALTGDDLQRTLALLDRIEEAGHTHLLVEGAATTALFFASAGEMEQAKRLVARAEARAGSLPAGGSWGLYNLAQCRAVVALMDGDEQAAAEALGKAVPPDGVLTGVSRQVCGKLESLYYLLVPETRDDWEADEPGPELRLARDVGRALVALRDQGDSRPAAALPWNEVGRLRTWAFEPHLAELSLAALEAGVAEAADALESLRHDPRAHIERATARLPAAAAKRATKRLSTIPRRPAAAVEIRVLGPTEVLLDGRPVDAAELTGRQRVHDLLLLLVDERRIRRLEVIDRLWADKDEASGNNNLRVTLSGLNKALEPQRSAKEPTWFVRTTGEWIEFGGVEQLTLDVDRFGELLADAQAADVAGSPQAALEALLAACDLYRGPYLADGIDTDIGYYDRIRFRGQFATAASRAAELSSGRGDWATAERLGVRAIEADPLNERCHRALVRALEQQNRVGAAREVLAVFLDDLSEAGLNAEPETSALAQRLGLPPSAGP